MKTDNINYEEPISTDNTPLYVEQYERDHIDWQYKSTTEQILCSGEESNYLDSEFSNELENTDQENQDDYDDALNEDPAEDDDDPYEDFEDEEDEETDDEDFEDDSQDDFDENISK